MSFSRCSLSSLDFSVSRLINSSHELANSLFPLVVGLWAVTSTAMSDRSYKFASYFSPQLAAWDITNTAKSKPAYYFMSSLKQMRNELRTIQLVVLNLALAISLSVATCSWLPCSVSLTKFGMAVHKAMIAYKVCFASSVLSSSVMKWPVLSPEV